ncbi:MAG: hypothetical protein JKY31_04060 [Rhodobacteraceae bacterium]|nr:hypothetical protein [Paracoccaceae bacterium]
MIMKFLPFVIGMMVVASCTSIYVDGELRNLSVRYESGGIRPESGAIFSIGTDYRQSFATAKNRLRAAGFQISDANLASGIITLTSTQNSLISCGTVTIGELDNPKSFAANVADAVMEVPAEGGGSTFVRRAMAVQSEVSISIGVDPEQQGAIFASINEGHLARLTLTQILNNVSVYSETIQFSGNSAGQFRRRVVCGSAGRIREILQGN